jgi:prepilin-type processing-associated H-X9-DG protein
MTWGVSGPLDSDNTNTATITAASLGVYANGATKIYRCPADNVLSAAQSAAGWQGRIRSYSMNAMVGNAGKFSAKGYNLNNPGYKQFFKLTQIPEPTDIFVFLDEHPDSINDGYFLNKDPDYTSNTSEWLHLPATYHNNATAFSYADGHSSIHRWLKTDTTVRPPVPDAANLPISIPATPADASADFEWMMDHMSIETQ